MSGMWSLVIIQDKLCDICIIKLIFSISSIGRHSKSLDIKIKRCDRCNGQLELLLNRTTRSGRLRSPIPIKEKPVTGFALYVKENFHKVSEDHGDVKPTEVMKLLAKQFTDMKIAK